MNKKVLLSNSAYRMGNVVITFLIHMLISRLTDAAGYGILSLLIANASIFNLLTAFGADAGLTFNAATGRLSLNKLLGFITGILLFQVVILAIVEFVVWTFSGHFLLLKSEEFRYWWVGLVFLIAISLTEKYSALLNGKSRFIQLNQTLLIGNIATLGIFSLIYFYASHEQVFYYIISYVLATLLQAFLLAFIFHKDNKETVVPAMPSSNERRIFYSYSFFAFINNIIQFLAYRVDYWILDYYRGEEELGWYSLAVRISQLFWILPMLYASIVMPSVASSQGKENSQNISLMIRGMNWMNTIAGLALFLMAPLFIPLFFGNNFENSVVLFQVLLPGVVLFCITTVLAGYFAGREKLWINFVGSVICLIVIICLDLLLIPGMGMKGAAIASSIGYGVTAIYSVIMYYRESNTRADKLFFPQEQDSKRIRSIFKTLFTGK